MTAQTPISPDQTPTDQTFADARRFMARVVPFDGENFVNLHYFTAEKKQNGQPWMNGTAVRDLDAFMRELKYRATHPEKARDIYFCTSNLRTAEEKVGKSGHTYLSAVREVENAAGRKSFCLDVDIGKRKKDGTPNGYQTRQEAAQGLGNLMRLTGLPMPTATVRSGSGGSHIYWVMADPMPAAEWQPWADAMVACAQESGLQFDHICTIDPVHLFRVPNTLNYKSNPPAAVELGHMLEFDYLNEKILTCLRPWLGRTPARTLAKNLPPDENDELSAGIEREYPPTDINKLAEQCAWIKQSLADGGTENDNTMRRYAFDLATECLEPRETAWRLMCNRDTLTDEEFCIEFERAERERAEGKAKPASCAKIALAGCEQCTTCPHKDAGLMPQNLPGVMMVAPIVENLHQNLIEHCATLKAAEPLFELDGRLVRFTEKEVVLADQMPGEGTAGDCQQSVEAHAVSHLPLMSLAAKHGIKFAKEPAQLIAASPDLYGFPQ